MREASPVLIPVFLVLTTLVFWARLLIQSRLGLDFTDESFYLLWAQRPWDYQASLTQFGFVYHPIYSLLGGDVVLYRMFNVLLTGGLALGLVSSALSGGLRKNPWLGPAFASGVFAVFSPWLLTPNYNVLNLQGLLLAGVGLLQTEKTSRRLRDTGWFLVGIAETLVFAAKPSSALALGVVILIYCLVSKKFCGRMIFFSLGGFLVSLMGLALFTDLSLWGFVQRLTLAYEDAQSLKSGYNPQALLRMDAFHLSFAEWILSVGMFAFLLGLRWLRRRSPGGYPKFLSGVTLLLCAYGLFLLVTMSRPVVAIGEHFGVMFLIPTVGLLIFRGRLLRSARIYLLAAVFLLMPYAYALGTNTSYASKVSGTAFFWVVGALLLGDEDPESGRVRSSEWGFLAAVTLLISVLLVMPAMLQPYRQAGFEQSVFEPIRVPPRSTLKVDRAEADYVRRFQESALGAGFVPSTPLLDLSGHSPGMAVILGARALGGAWLLGGYAGSSNYVGRLLSRVSCQDLAAAWVVIQETEHPRSLPWSVLEAQGLGERSDYTPVVSVPHFQEVPAAPQILLRPLRSARALRECEARRQVSAPSFPN